MRALRPRASKAEARRESARLAVHDPPQRLEERAAAPRPEASGRRPERLELRGSRPTPRRRSMRRRAAERLAARSRPCPRPSARSWCSAAWRASAIGRSPTIVGCPAGTVMSRWRAPARCCASRSGRARLARRSRMSARAATRCARAWSRPTWTASSWTRTAAFERHVAACGACRALARSTKRPWRLAVARRRCRGPRPPMRSASDRGPEHPSPGRARGEPRRRPLALAHWPRRCRSVVVAMLSPRRAVRRRSPAPASALVAVAVDTHLRFARRAASPRSAVGRPDEVSRWFAGRVPFHLTCPTTRWGRASEKLYRLVGGRLVGLRAATTRRTSRIGWTTGRSRCWSTSADKVRPEGGDAVKSGGLTFHHRSPSPGSR